MILFESPFVDGLIAPGMDLSSEQIDDLREVAGSRHVSADVALRARIALWSAEGRRRKDRPRRSVAGDVDRVDRWKARYTARGLAGL
ncbi:hypothetical protein [Streptomyces sp. 8N706]|uniref:hypothetical protein n=1 Tax=Streptomyces sp. 8N706 TaxID=3457416 RepID=UPI003FD1FA64